MKLENQFKINYNLLHEKFEDTKGKSETVTGKTDNTKNNQWSTKHYKENKRLNNANPKVSRRGSEINLIMYAQNRKIGKPNNLRFGSNKTKGPKQVSQNLLWSLISDRGEP